MSSFGKKRNSILDQPRYKEKPALLLFEFFALDVIGQLSDSRRQGIEQLDLKKMFNTSESDWKAAVKQTLSLSGTIDVAILDRWYGVKEQKAGVSAEDFCRALADEYFAEGSTIDVWPEGRLDAAKKHIEKCRAKGL